MRKLILELNELVLEILKLLRHLVQHQSPGLLKVVVLLKATSDLPFVLSIMICDLRLSLLVDLNLEASFTWPLLSQVFIKLFNALILKLLAFSPCFEIVDLFLLNQPLTDCLKSSFKNF